jgi:hypothetical protein
MNEIGRHAAFAVEAARNPHLPPVDPETLLNNDGYSAPPRPHTLMHVVVRRAVDILPTTQFEWEDFVDFRENSLQTFEALGVTATTLDNVRNSARWILADRPSPTEVGGVEAKFNDQQTPLAILYRHCPATSFPKSVSEVLVQTGVDHLVGHLTLGVIGLEREDENKACLLQYMAARQRAKLGNKRFGAYVLAMIPGFKIQKHIPLDNFTKRKQAHLLASMC